MRLTERMRPAERLASTVAWERFLDYPVATGRLRELADVRDDSEFEPEGGLAEEALEEGFKAGFAFALESLDERSRDEDEE